MKPRNPPLQSAHLLDQVRERVRYLHYSFSPEKTYLYWGRFFVRCHRGNGQITHPTYPLDIGRRWRFFDHADQSPASPPAAWLAWLAINSIASGACFDWVGFPFDAEKNRREPLQTSFAPPGRSMEALKQFLERFLACFYSYFRSVGQ